MKTAIGIVERELRHLRIEREECFGQGSILHEGKCQEAYRILGLLKEEEKR